MRHHRSPILERELGVTTHSRRWIGLTLGDILGILLEFKQKGSFILITGLEAWGAFDLPPGYWTEDTSTILCMADSFIAQGGYDSYDLTQRYADWQHHGYRSSMNTCFDIGNRT